MAHFQTLPYARARVAREHGVLVVGQRDAIPFSPPPYTSLIRICGDNPTGISDFQPLTYRDAYSEVLELTFDDVDYKRYDHNKVIDSNQAALIVDLFERHSKLKATHPDALLMVHCQGGISRSSAVGCAWGYWQDLASWPVRTDIEEAIRSSGWAVPNSMVYQTIRLEIDRRTYEAP